MNNNEKTNEQQHCFNPEIQKNSFRYESSF